MASSELELQVLLTIPQASLKSCKTKTIQKVTSKSDFRMSDEEQSDFDITIVEVEDD